MSILSKVYFSLLADTKLLSGVHLDLPDDFDVSWVLIEGPKLDKELLQFIEGNRVDYPDFPEWLLPLWKAFLANNNQASILRLLRTILVFGYKAEHEPSKDQLSFAQKAFEEANLAVGEWGSWFQKNQDPVPPLFREARRQISGIIGSLDYREVLPKHGPGAVFPPHRPCEKSNFIHCAPIAEYYPYDQLFNGLPELGADDLRQHHPESTSKDVLCRMTAVPKDSRGPRLISVHPKECIWLQQGQRTILERRIESHRLTRGRVNFRDQSINGKLALSSSKDRKFVTIDLKEASDRVSKVLIEYLLGYHAKVLGCSRASHVLCLDGSTAELHLWAPMGNCLTFPIESIVFWSLVRAGILCRHGHHCDDVYVFGDDIIVPTQYYDGAIYGLVMAGLIPNFSKTFRKGLFRESCGVDAYNGEDVTPYRMKVRGVNSYSDAESLCDLAKRLRIGGFVETSAYLYSKVSQKFGRLSLTNNPHAQGMIEYVDYDIWKLFRYEPRLIYNEKLFIWEVPYRKQVRTLEVITRHAWWHVQDSLLRLEHIALGTTDSPQFGGILTEDQFYGERGLRYPTPRGVRLARGMCQIIWPQGLESLGCREVPATDQHS